MKKVLDFFKKIVKILRIKVMPFFGKVGKMILNFFQIVWKRILGIVNKLGKKKSAIIFGGALGVILLIFILVSVINTDSGGSSLFDGIGNKSFKEEYEKLNNKKTDDGKKYPEVKIPSDDIIKYSSLNEIISLFENDMDAVVYLGYPTCLYCRTVVNVLFDEVGKTKLDKIYYLDIEKQGKKFDKLYDLLGEYLVDEVDGDRKIDAPLVFFIVNGEIVGYKKGSLSSQASPYDTLNEKQLEELSSVYYYGIANVLSSIGYKKETENVG